MKLKLSKLEDLRNKTATEIDEYIAQTKVTLAQMRREIAKDQGGKTHQIGLIKKSIAQASTVKSSKANSKGKES